MEADETVTGALEAVEAAVEAVLMSFMDSAVLRMEGWLLGCRGALLFPPSRGLSSYTLGESESEWVRFWQVCYINPFLIHQK
jgi:hypothetical protein